MGIAVDDKNVAALSGLITKHEEGLLSAWMRNQLEAGSLRSGQIREDELQQQSSQFLRDFTICAQIRRG
jgi:hypothetical protein